LQEISLAVMFFVLILFGVYQMIYPLKVYKFTKRLNNPGDQLPSPKRLVLSRLSGGMIAVLSAWNLWQLWKATSLL
jgi:Na+/proline symporter